MTCPFNQCDDDDCDYHAFCLLSARQITVADTHHAHVAAQQEQEDSQQQVAGVHAGYEIATDCDLIQTADGGLIRARSVSSGARARGELTTASLTQGSLVGWTDSMPS